MRQSASRAVLTFAVVFSGATVAGCANEADATIPDLQGRWILESIDGKAIESKAEIYLEIDGRTITGFDGCNSFGGSLDAPESLRMTQRACPGDGPRLPLEILDGSVRLEASHLDGDTLEVALPDRAGKAKLRRTKK